MNRPAVRIGSIDIRVPGLSPAAARTLANDVAARVASGVADGPTRARSIDAVRIRVPASANRQANLADTIAMRILEALR
ncbi:MAG: hypothetical protein ABJC09_00495 [Terriglobia bacterium]